MKPKRRWKWLPFTGDRRVASSWVEITLKPFLILAGLLSGVSSSALISRRLDWLQQVMEQLGLTAWLQSQLLIWQYMTAFAVLAFLLLIMVRFRVLDGLWIFSVARNFLILAVLCLFVLIFTIFTQDLFTGYFLIGLMLVVIVSFLAFGPSREYLKYREIGNFLGEIILVICFLVLFKPILWSLPAGRSAAEMILEHSAQLTKQLMQLIASYF